jgi:hypothetical protein
MYGEERRQVNERFAELMAKGQTGRLTAAETEELARLLNGPILDPLDNPPTAFVSDRSFAPRDIPGRLRAIEWFSRCGEPLSLTLSMPVVRVTGWPEAVASCMDGVWENVELEAQNQLTLWLHQHDRQNYQRWNDLVDRFKSAVLNPLTEERWEPYRRRNGLDVAVVHSAHWDVLGALMENVYLRSGHRCFFFLELLSVYEAGHFPCGWVGEWPQGNLVVY